MGARSKSPRNGKSKSRGRSPTPKRGTNSVATPKKERVNADTTLEKLGGIWDLAQGKKGVPRATQKLGEAIFMFSNSLAAIGIIMVNKTLLQSKERGGFGFNGLTSSLTFFHFCCTLSVLLVATRWGVVKRRPFPKGENWWWGVLLAVTMACAPLASNFSLLYNSVATYQLAKIAQTPLIATVEVLTGGRSLSIAQGLSLTGVIAGVITAEVDLIGEGGQKSHGNGNGMPGGGPNWRGIVLAAAAVLFASTHKMLGKKFVEQGWSPADLLVTMYPLSTALLGVMTLLVEGGQAVTVFRDLHASGGLTGNALACCALSGCFAFLVTLSQVIVVGTMSALTHSLLAQAKTACTILGGALLLQEFPHMQQVSGAASAMACLFYYAALTLRAADKAAADGAPARGRKAGAREVRSPDRLGNGSNAKKTN